MPTIEQLFYGGCALACTFIAGDVRRRLIQAEKWRVHVLLRLARIDNALKLPPYNQEV